MEILPKITLLFLTFAVTAIYCQDNEDKGPRLSNENQIVNDLLEDYKQIERPVDDSNKTMKVEVGVGLIRIHDFNIRKRVLTTTVWLRYKWQDDFLKWDPSAYGHITTVRIPANRIWTPDVVLYNSPTSEMDISSNTLAVIDNKGQVLFIPPANLKSICVYDGKKAEQECIMKFGSWTYDSSLVDINFYDKKANIDMNDFFESSDWIVTNTTAVKEVKRYPCCEATYPDLQFKLKLKKRK